jgi:hypothetical protein
MKTPEFKKDLEAMKAWVKNLAEGTASLVKSLASFLSWLGVSPALASTAGGGAGLLGTMPGGGAGGGGADGAPSLVRASRRVAAAAYGAGGGGRGRAYSAPTGTDDERAMRVMDKLIATGLYTEAGAAIAAGNAMQESGINPSRPAGDKGISHGMFQWNKDRYARLQRYQAAHRNTSPEDVQIGFMTGGQLRVFRD